MRCYDNLIEAFRVSSDCLTNYPCDFVELITNDTVSMLWRSLFRSFITYFTPFIT